MKVLVSSSSLLFTDKPHISSEGYNAFELCSNLAGRDIDMTILAPQTDLDNHCFAEILKPRFACSERRTENSSIRWLMYNLAALKMISDIDVEQFDVIHHIFPTGIDVAYSLVPHAIKTVPFVYGPVLPPATPYPNRIGIRDRMMTLYVKTLSRPLYRSTLRKAATIIVSVDSVRRFLPASLIRKTKVICHGIPTDEYAGNENKESTGSFTILLLARLSEEKGIDMAIEAIGKLSKTVPDVRLVIAGSGPLREELKQLTLDRGLDENVHFAGLVKTHKDKIRLFKMCDVFCHPALRDATPTAVLEAMAAGKAIVATSAGGVPEFLDYGRCGILVPPSDVDSLVRALYKLFTNEDLRRRLGQRALLRAKGEYDIRIVAKRVEDVYRKAASSA